MKQKYTLSQQKLKGNNDRVSVLALAGSMRCAIFCLMRVANADYFD